jgi:site-specific recombinase XerD
MIVIEDKVNVFIDYLNAKRYTRPTIANYSRFAKEFLNFCNINKVNIVEISSETLLDYKEHLNLLNLTGSSVNAKIHAIITFCKSCNIYFVDPKELQLFEKNKGKKSIRQISEKDFKHVINQIDTTSPAGMRDLAILELIYYSGLKPGEIVNLNKFDLDQSSIKVVDRKILLDQQVIFNLNNYQLSRTDNDESFFINFNPGTKLQVSRRLSLRSIENIVKSYFHKAGLLECSIMDLRSSRTLNLFSKSKDIEIIKIYRHNEIKSDLDFLNIIRLS